MVSPVLTNPGNQIPRPRINSGSLAQSRPSRPFFFPCLAKSSWPPNGQKRLLLVSGRRRGNTHTQIGKTGGGGGERKNHGEKHPQKAENNGNKQTEKKREKQHPQRNPLAGVPGGPQRSLPAPAQGRGCEPPAPLRPGALARHDRSSLHVSTSTANHTGIFIFACCLGWTSATAPFLLKAWRWWVKGQGYQHMRVCF